MPSRFSQRWAVVTSQCSQEATSFQESRRSSGAGGFSMGLSVICGSMTLRRALPGQWGGDEWQHCTPVQVGEAALDGIRRQMAMPRLAL